MPSADIGEDAKTIVDVLSPMLVTMKMMQTSAVNVHMPLCANLWIFRKLMKDGKENEFQA